MLRQEAGDSSTFLSFKSGQDFGEEHNDYLPFGEEAAPMFGVYNTHAFTGHERDGSGLDYMMARYYEAGLGRFLSVDPKASSAKVRHPESWNRYTHRRSP